jgi:hypothetical protein
MPSQLLPDYRQLGTAKSKDFDNPAVFFGRRAIYAVACRGIGLRRVGPDSEACGSSASANGMVVYPLPGKCTIFTNRLLAS